MANNTTTNPASDFGAGLTNTATNTAQSAISGFNPQDIAGTQRAGFTSLLGSQMGAGGPTSSQDYFNRYTQAVASNPSVTGLYNTANQMFNVPQLSQEAARLQSQVAGLPAQQYQLARGFDVSDPQVQNAINVAGRFLNPQAQQATNLAQTAQGLAGQYVQAGLTQNQLNLLPIQQQGNMLSDALARQSTGWTQAAEQEFAALQAKMSAGIALSAQEQARANALLTAQTDYQKALVGVQFQNVPYGNNLVNTLAGTIINPGMLTSNTGTFKF